MRSLIEREGADIQELDGEGNTPLHWAVYTPDSPRHLSVAQYLLDSGANMDAGNQLEGQTPLMWACIAGNVPAVLLLKERGADLHQEDQRGYNALQHAAQYNEALVCYYLIKRGGVSVDATDHAGHTALHWASYLGHENLTRLLVNCRASINLQDIDGNTPLHWAATKGQEGAARILLELGADSEVEDREGLIPSEAAERKGYFGLANRIWEQSSFYGY